MSKFLVIAISAVCGLVIGFFVGRSVYVDSVRTAIRYVDRPVISGQITQPTILREWPDIIDINDIKFAWLLDTVIIHDTPHVQIDTAAIMKDWTTKREYGDTLFNNDTVGRMEVFSKVQFNRLQNMSYTFTPKQKEITTTITTKDRFAPFVMIGLDDRISPSAQAGIWYKNIGVAYDIRYERIGNENKVVNGIKIGYKF